MMERVVEVEDVNIAGAVDDMKEIQVTLLCTEGTEWGRENKYSGLRARSDNGGGARL